MKKCSYCGREYSDDTAVCAIDGQSLIVPSERPNTPPPLFRDQRKADADHLKLLAVFHFVGAGLALLGLLFLSLHFLMMHEFLTNPKMWAGSKQAQPQMPPPAEFFAIFKWFYLLGAAWFMASGILNLLSGLFLLTRKHRMFSMVVAGMNCVHMPLGTVLGVFTLVVLLRDSVREAYEA